MLGIVWSLVTPLLLLGVYTFVFTSIFKSHWTDSASNKGEFALILFSGLMLFNFFAECVTRAPSLMLENISYIKKVVFPLEVLPWVSLLASFMNFLIAFGAFMLFYLYLHGIPHIEILLLPLLWLPLGFITLGLVWFLSSLGVYLRDLRHVVGVATTMLMFLTPVFYPLSGVPESVRGLVTLNPLSVILENSRTLLFFSENGLQYISILTTWAVSLVCAWIGLIWFAKTKKGFADVT